jgi:hypothetical protein
MRPRQPEVPNLMLMLMGGVGRWSGGALEWWG